jgi:serine phosphatase RsbU (regulator of sigma subunit)
LVSSAVPDPALAEPPSRRRLVTALTQAVTVGSGPIWVLSASMLAAALGLGLGLGGLDGVGVPSAPIVLPWWALAAGFLLAEVAVVNYDFRREAHSFSMNELPMVLGLFFATAQDLVLGTVVGTAAALLVHRRQAGMKLVFNLGHFALGAVLAVVIFRAVAGPTPSFAPQSWIAVLLATVVTSALSTGAIFLAISLSERRLELGKLPEQLGLALLTTVGSASLGLMGVGVAWQHPAAAWLLVVPVGSFFLAYRGYVLKRQERDSLEFLYRSVRILDEAPDLATGMSRVLLGACQTFRAELAQFALLSQHDGRLAMVVTVTGDTAHTAERQPLEAVDGLLHRALQSPRSQILGLDPPVASRDGHALRQVMIGPLRTESQTLGALLVGNRLGAAATFKGSDLRLLETLVSQVSVSLENGRLARTLTETAHRADRERHNALVLQRGILPPPLPRVPGASVAVRYLPGAVGMEVGGDWYDVIPLPGGDVGVAIGDVVGHDLEAAARMGQARSALRAYATEGHRPAPLMERLNRLLTQTDADFLGTCCYLQFSPRQDTVTLVSAGHPPPLLIDPDGRPQPVKLDPNLPLGVEERTTYSETTMAMPPGATLVLYTDGLVESRTLPLDAGMARLAQVPTHIAQGHLEALAEHLLTQRPSGPTEDDVTLLLLRHRGAAGPADA